MIQRTPSGRPFAQQLRKREAAQDIGNIDFPARNIRAPDLVKLFQPLIRDFEGRLSHPFTALSGRQPRGVAKSTGGMSQRISSFVCHGKFRTLMDTKGVDWGPPIYCPKYSSGYRIQPFCRLAETEEYKHTNVIQRRIPVGHENRIGAATRYLLTPAGNVDPGMPFHRTINGSAALRTTAGTMEDLKMHSPKPQMDLGETRSERYIAFER